MKPKPRRIEETPQPFEDFKSEISKSPNPTDNVVKFDRSKFHVYENSDSVIFNGKMEINNVDRMVKVENSNFEAKAKKKKKHKNFKKKKKKRLVICLLIYCRNRKLFANIAEENKVEIIYDFDFS